MPSCRCTAVRQCALPPALRASGTTARTWVPVHGLSHPPMISPLADSIRHHARTTPRPLAQHPHATQGRRQGILLQSARAVATDVLLLNLFRLFFFLAGREFLMTRCHCSGGKKGIGYMRRGLKWRLTMHGSRLWGNALSVHLRALERGMKLRGLVKSERLGVFSV
ncbi:hypothetical protein EDB89DRAFT_1938875 [Lactarius sanguifluus]|nr:hypothetical protein EDB89DRAFT_1938875 [Lactarius sanguifluus]